MPYSSAGALYRRLPERQIGKALQSRHILVDEPLPLVPLEDARRTTAQARR
jgi:hypothetical protein